METPFTSLYACPVLCTHVHFLSLCFDASAVPIFPSVHVIMSVCSLVIDKVSIRSNGITRSKIGRIIVGFQDAETDAVSFDNKYIYYPPEDFVYNDFCYKYNRIDRNTIAKQGERHEVVMDWVRAAVRGKNVIVCGRLDLNQILGDVPCHVVDLQDFFFTKNESNIVEPISLNRLTNRLFGHETHSTGNRDPFQECKFKISLYHVMKGFKSGNLFPPFHETFFPKVPKGFSAVAYKHEAVVLPQAERDSDWNGVSHHSTKENLSRACDDKVKQRNADDLHYKNLQELSLEDRRHREPDECGARGRFGPVREII